jgi:dTDP-4-amino-4,6-dideoxygalactose transaminase
MNPIQSFINFKSGKNCKQIFVNSLKEYFNVRYVHLTSSCTSSIFHSLKSLGVEESDEVILPDSTYPATLNSILHLKAIPILCDAKNLFQTLSIDEIKKKITSATKAIVVVHQNGVPHEMEEILSLSSEFKIPIIEDVARSFGAKINGQLCGTIGKVGCLSFNSMKILSAGGGAIITNSLEVSKYLQLSCGYGTDDKNQFQFPGYNSTISDYDSIIGNFRLQNIRSILDQRREIFNFTYSLLKDEPEINFMEPIKYSIIVHPTFSIHIPKWEIGELRLVLGSNNIITHSFRAIHKEPYYAEICKFNEESYPVSLSIHKHSFCLDITENTSKQNIRKASNIILNWIQSMKNKI